MALQFFTLFNITALTVTTPKQYLLIIKVVY
jgi:hypothetical protein